MITVQTIPVTEGWSRLEVLVVKTDEQPDTTTKVVTYKGKKKTKTFRGEVSHHDAERWANDIILPVIHGAKTQI